MIRTDILEEHLEEVDFLWQQRADALEAEEQDPEYMAELEERLTAHLEGLLVGGEAAWKLLEPKLEGGEVGEAFAAGWVAARSGNERWMQRARRAMEEGVEAVRVGVREGHQYLLEST